MQTISSTEYLLAPSFKPGTTKPFLLRVTISVSYYNMIDPCLRLSNKKNLSSTFTTVSNNLYYLGLTS